MKSVMYTRQLHRIPHNPSIIRTMTTAAGSVKMAHKVDDHHHYQRRLDVSPGLVFALCRKVRRSKCCLQLLPQLDKAGLHDLRDKPISMPASPVYRFDETCE